MTERPSPWPKKGGKTHMLLDRLLNGVRVDPAYAVMELNLPTFQARCSELRKLGWPIRTMKVAHPRRPFENWDVYFMDAHFRAWWVQQDAQGHPMNYTAGADGLGKFAQGE